MGSKGAIEKNKFSGKFKFSYGLQSRFQATSVRRDSFLICNNYRDSFSICKRDNGVDLLCVFL